MRNTTRQIMRNSFPRKKNSVPKMQNYGISSKYKKCGIMVNNAEKL